MIKMTPELAGAVAQDAANASAKLHGGPPWTKGDCSVYFQTYNRLWPDRFVNHPDRTLAEHAEAWWQEQGSVVPDRKTPAWDAMYENWIDFAFPMKSENE